MPVKRDVFEVCRRDSGVRESGQEGRLKKVFCLCKGRGGDH